MRCVEDTSYVVIKNKKKSYQNAECERERERINLLPKLPMLTQ